MSDNRSDHLRELELEFRYLCLVEKEAEMAKVDWIVKLARDLKANLQAFWSQIEAEAKHG